MENCAKRSIAVIEIADEHHRQIDRDEGIDPAGLDTRQRPGRDQNKDGQQAEHNDKREPFLRRPRRRARKGEMLLLRVPATAFCIGAAPTGSRHGRTPSSSSLRTALPHFAPRLVPLMSRPVAAKYPAATNSTPRLSSLANGHATT